MEGLAGRERRGGQPGPCSELECVDAIGYKVRLRTKGIWEKESQARCPVDSEIT